MKTRQCDPISGGFCVLPRVPCKPARLCSEKPWARGERLCSRPGPTGDTGLQVGPRNTFSHLPLFVHQGGRGAERRSRAPSSPPPGSRSLCSRQRLGGDSASVAAWALHKLRAGAEMKKLSPRRGRHCPRSQGKSGGGGSQE